jgi:two-component system, NarL family, response regulator DevR
MTRSTGVSMEIRALRSVRVFLVDDHEVVRRGLQDLLENKRDISVVGDCGSAAEAPARVVATRPDVMVLDLHLRDRSGVAVSRHVRSVDPRVKVLLLTAADDDEALLSTIIAGAHGYVLKEARTASLVDAIRRLARGEPLLTREAREQMVQRLAGLGQSPADLTAAQRQTLRRLVQGLVDPQRAEGVDHLGEMEGDVEVLIPKLVEELARSGRPR